MIKPKKENIIYSAIDYKELKRFKRRYKVSKEKILNQIKKEKSDL